MADQDNKQGHKKDSKGRTYYTNEKGQKVYTGDTSAGSSGAGPKVDVRKKPAPKGFHYDDKGSLRKGDPPKKDPPKEETPDTKNKPTPVGDIVKEEQATKAGGAQVNQGIGALIQSVKKKKKKQY